MPKVVVVGRPDESGYDLWYGKKSNGITLFAEKQSNGKFKCPQLFGGDSRMLKDIKSTFEAWALGNTPDQPSATPMPIESAEPDRLASHERAFFARIATVVGVLNEADQVELREVANRLTGIRIKQDTHAHGTSSVPRNVPPITRTPSGPPPFRPRVAGPPVYSKPPRTGGGATAYSDPGEHAEEVSIPDSSEAGGLPGE